MLTIAPTLYRLAAACRSATIHEAIAASAIKYGFPRQAVLSSDYASKHRQVALDIVARLNAISQQHETPARVIVINYEVDAVVLDDDPA